LHTAQADGSVVELAKHISYTENWTKSIVNL